MSRICFRIIFRADGGLDETLTILGPEYLAVNYTVLSTYVYLWKFSFEMLLNFSTNEKLNTTACGRGEAAVVARPTAYRGGWGVGLERPRGFVASGT